MHIRINAYAYVHICIHAYMHMHMHVHMHVRMHLYLHVHLQLHHPLGLLELCVGRYPQDSGRKMTGKTSEKHRKMQECNICKRERARRCIVLGGGNNDDIPETMKRFSGAAYVHPYNQPKYHAQILRAVSFARASSERIYWCLAEDWPITADDEELSQEDIARMQEKFLERHDRDTAGIPGIFPLIYNLSLRFTKIYLTGIFWNPL